MSATLHIRRAVAGLACAAMLAVSVAPASALTGVDPAPPQTGAAAHIQKVWCGWGGCGWGGGWGPAAAVTGVIAGTALGAAALAGSAPYYGPGYPYGPGYAYGPGYYPAGYYGPRRYGPCWRRWIDRWGRPHWRRAC